MRKTCLQPILAIFITVLIPITSNAADNSSASTQFKASCIKSWMDNAGDSGDKLIFQNFGEKFCACAASKPSNSDADMQNAAKFCMSQTLLHDVMDTFKNQPDLKNLSEDKIESACQNVWKIIYPTMDNNFQQSTVAYCQCTGPKLFDLTKKSASLSGVQFSAKIDGIATDCADKADVGNPTNGNNDDNEKIVS